MFWNSKNKFKVVGVQLLVTNFKGYVKVRGVYDTGNGPFIYDWAGETPRYLEKDGTLNGAEHYTCNGDPVTWAPHVGNPDSLNWQ